MIFYMIYHILALEGYMFSYSLNPTIQENGFLYIGVVQYRGQTRANAKGIRGRRAQIS